MNLIVAVDANWGIGKNNDLLFHVPEDMKFFRKMTLEKTVVCGKNTLLSFPGSKPLPKRKHFVLTHQNFEQNENLVVVDSIDTLLEKTKEIPADDIFVIGGESVYRQLLPFCKKAYVTRFLTTDPEADTFFPNLDENVDFVLIDAGEEQVSENGIRFKFTIYENKAI